jgi:hypothetical protein
VFPRICLICDQAIREKSQIFKGLGDLLQRAEACGFTFGKSKVWGKGNRREAEACVKGKNILDRVDIPQRMFPEFTLPHEHALHVAFHLGRKREVDRQIGRSLK